MDVIICVEVHRLSGFDYVRAELSLGWVDPRVGLSWVGLGGSEISVFNGLCWVMGLKLRICEKLIRLFLHRLQSFRTQ